MGSILLFVRFSSYVTFFLLIQVYILFKMAIFLGMHTMLQRSIELGFNTACPCFSDHVEHVINQLLPPVLFIRNIWLFWFIA